MPRAPSQPDTHPPSAAPGGVPAAATGGGQPSLAAIAGHTAAVASLRRQIEDGTLPHALLITGPERAGKTTLALALAWALLDAPAWPGGPAAHPDLWVEDSDAERISISRVRAGAPADEGQSLQDFLALRPYAGGRRVAVIGRAERLTEDAANSLLKTIEEPPPQTHIILSSANPDALPPTILSRCQTVPLSPVPAAAVAEWLEREHGVSAELAGAAAPLAGGRPGRALRLATEPGALNAELDALDGFIGVAGGGVSGALRAAAALAPPAGAEGRERALLQLGAWTMFLRDVVCAVEGVPELVLWTGYRDAVDTWAAALPRERAVAMLGAAMKAVADIAANAQPRLCYEVLFIDLFGGVGGAVVPPPAAIPERTGAMAAAPAGALRSRSTTAKRPAPRRTKSGRR